MSSLQKIIEDIKKLKEPYIIGISGFGGSGKTTLANIISKDLNIPIVCIDSFWRNNTDDYSNWEIVDSERFLKEVIVPFQNFEKELEYGCFDWVKNNCENKNKIYNSGKLIVEGVGIFTPELANHFDYKIWVKTDLDKSLDRGKERDRKDRGYREDLAWDNQWDSVWKRNDQEFFDKFSPEKLANIVFENN